MRQRYAKAGKKQFDHGAIGAAMTVHGIEGGLGDFRNLLPAGRKVFGKIMQVHLQLRGAAVQGLDQALGLVAHLRGVVQRALYLFFQ